MKKITLLFALILAAVSVNAQVLFYDDVPTNPEPAYTKIDGDGRAISSFYTNQNVFTNGSWSLSNFGSPLGVAYYSCSSFIGSDSCQSTNDFLVLPLLDFTNANATPFLTFEAATSGDTGTMAVFATTSIAGSTPVASDFTGSALGTFALVKNTYTKFTADLTSLAGQNTVYIAIVNKSTLCNGFIALREIYVKNNIAKDLSVTTSNLVTEDIERASAALNYNYSIVPCGVNNSTVSVTIKNSGTQAFNDTAFIGYRYENTVIEDTVLTYITNPIPVAGTVTHTFTTNIDFTTFESTVFSYWALGGGADTDLVNSTKRQVLIAPNTVDLSTTPYFTSFERSNTELAKTLAIKIENSATAATEWEIQDFSRFSDKHEYLQSGDRLMRHSYIGPSSPLSLVPSDNWFFTSCMSFDATKHYRVSFYYTTSFGNIVPHTINFAVGDDYGSSNMTNVASATLEDTLKTFFFKEFQVSTSGNKHFGVQNNSPRGWYLTMDDLKIEEVKPPTAPAVSSSWNACDSTARVTFNYILGNTYTINWGDGTTETVTASPAEHKYTILGPQSATVTVSNAAGTANSSTAITTTAPAVPTGAFTFTQNGTSVNFTVANPNPCSTYEWSFGDNTPNATGTSTSHTYTAAGSYTVTLTETNTLGSMSTTQTVVITTSINEINFVNGINVFPNPTNDNVKIEFELNSAQNVEIALVSLDGKVVKTLASSNVTKVNEKLNVANLAKGIYILDITTAEGKFTTNLVVK